jgi:serine protease
MATRKSSSALVWLALMALALAGVPIAWTLHAAHTTGNRAGTRLDWPAPAAGAWTEPNEIEVQFKPGNGADAIKSADDRIGLTPAWSGAQPDQEEIDTFDTPAGADTDTILSRLRSDPDVEAADVEHLYAEPESEAGAVPAPAADAPAPDRRGWRPNDPRYGEQWNFQMVHCEQAWEKSRGKGVIVAVIDTGVAYADTRKGKQARDFNTTGFAPGYDFTTHDSLPNDDNGHGTHVAGTIAESTDNGEGVAGLAFEATIMPLKVLTAQGWGRSSDIADAIRWAADHGANVINMSLGGPVPDRLMRSACAYAHQKGVTIVCAAGNSGQEGVGFPAAYPDCIAVSAVGPGGKLSFYSSWGKPVAIAAPGGDKLVDPNNGGILQNTVMADENGALVDDYYAFQGTSMASPHVAATAALIEAQGIRDPDDVKAVLQRSAQHADGPRVKYGAGILDAGAAVGLAGAIYGDGVARFWFVALLFAGCYLVGRSRKGVVFGPRYPVLGAAAFAFGLLFPDWLSGYVGQTSCWNLVGHSVLIPLGLLLLGTTGRTERRLLGWTALGLTLHIGWEFLRGTLPVSPDLSTLRIFPWIVVNVLAGLGIMISGLARRDV